MDWDLFRFHFVRMAIAFVLALPVAWDREHKERSAGLRTFPLVALASCSYMLIGTSFLAQSPDAQARILQGLITGIGFVGGGAILKRNDRTKGTANAACIWSTGALGAAVAFGRYEIAVLLSAINFATLRWLSAFKSDQE